MTLLTPSERKAVAREVIMDAWADACREAEAIGAIPSIVRFVDRMNAEHHGSADRGKLREAMDIYYPLQLSTIQRWRALFRRHGGEALLGRYGNRKGANRIQSDEAILTEITTMAVAGKKAPSIRQALLEKFGVARTPSLATVRRFLASTAAA